MDWFSQSLLSCVLYAFDAVFLKLIQNYGLTTNEFIFLQVPLRLLFVLFNIGLESFNKIRIYELPFYGVLYTIITTLCAVYAASYYQNALRSVLFYVPI